MTVIGFSRLTDLFGIMYADVDEGKFSREKFIEYLDEMSEITNKLPTDDDSKYIVQSLFLGTSHRDASAQMEVLKDESVFMNQLKYALEHMDIKQKIQDMVN